MALHVETMGAGPPITLLHGWGMHGGVWRDCAERLARTHFVRLVDLPGHGHSHSEVPAPDYTLDYLADSVAATLPERGALVGWSLGGLVALTITLRYPAAIDRLALIGSTPQFVSGPGWSHGLDAAVLEDFAARLRSDPPSTIRRFLTLQVRGSVDERATLGRLKRALAAAPTPAPHALEGGLAILRDTSLRRELAGARLPVALIHGTRDTLAPYPAAEATAALMPQARLHPVTGTGHAPFLSDADAVVAILKGLADGA